MKTIGLALCLSCWTVGAFAPPTLAEKPKLAKATPTTTSHTATAPSNGVGEKSVDTALLLQDCVCLVTGASRGIGKGIALELGKQGATVYVTGTSSSNHKGDAEGPFSTTVVSGGPGTIEETAAEITEAGGQGIAVYCNHAVDSDVQKVMDLIESEHGRLDILVNNVFRLPEGGAAQLNKKFWEQGPATWDCVHTVGLRSHYVATCFAMPLIFKARDKPLASLPRPIIAMISSFGGLSYTFNLPYGVGKAGVDRMAKDMAIELDNENICIVSFYPGLVNTERTQRSVENGEWDKYVGLPLDNSETPNFSGKAIIAVATDADNLKKSGTVQIVAELAEEYGFTDFGGNRPPSIRSLRFLLHSYAFSDEMRQQISPEVIPNVKLPLWIMAQGRPPAKE